MNGNVTKEGIQKDLDWMKRIGIGGFQNFDANLFTPVVVPKKLVFMQPDWKEAFRYAAELADKNGLEMAIAGSPGWSVTGGPWVAPKDGMKKYVWTETHVKGGSKNTTKLPTPPGTTGNFQNVGLPVTNLLGGTSPPLPTYYADAAVIAFRLPAGEKSLRELNPKVTSSGGTFTLDQLTDGDLSTTTFLPPSAVGEDMWIQYEFSTSQVFKAMSIVGAVHIGLEEFNGGPENRSIKVSDDGIVFREVAQVSGSIVPQNTVAFTPTSAKYWRIAFKTLPPGFNPIMAMFGVTPDPNAKPDGVNIAEFVLCNTDRVDQFEDKAGFSPWKENTRTFVPSSADAIPRENVIDLTSSMKPDGTLDWVAPEGTWLIIRLGYSLTGRQNHPASPEATGLEVDKLDPLAVKSYINTYLDMYKETAGGLMGNKGLTHMILDSYEAGHMTWTANMPGEFHKRRGYSMVPWLPVLTGRVIESAEASEKFLWDFRKTIGEMIAENHYDVIGEELHKRGMKRYTESHENKRIYLADGMDVKRNADIPMSAMWTPGSLAGGENEEPRSEADIRESASVAHIYGKPIVAAESMTAIQNSFAYSPERLKRTADLEMASGLNRFVIHTSVHQPLDDRKPGFSLGPFGQWFTRHETWAEQAKSWMDYLARSCYLLQQGRYVADILYFYGENTNITSICETKLPDLPQGYSYDFVNASGLINAVQVKDNRLVTPGGMAYSLLILDESARQMTLPVLKKLSELARAGARIAGTRPERSPSLSDDPKLFKSLSDEIWGGRYPNITESKNYAELLSRSGVSEDIMVTATNSSILYVHRQMNDRDIYWLNSRSASVNDAVISFRVADKIPELWNPVTGLTQKVGYRVENGRTVISLRFESWDAYFVVFREKPTSAVLEIPQVVMTPALTLTGPWKVSFQEGRGAPGQATFEKLIPWNESPDAGIKYFSGTARYESSFVLKKIVKGANYVVDLGDVKNVAEVIVNGHSMGILWKTPFKVDVTRALVKGNNAVEVRVTNLWVNRLIGDAQPGVSDKITFTTLPFYRAESPLLPSGLLGPVVLLQGGSK